MTYQLRFGELEDGEGLDRGEEAGVDVDSHDIESSS